MSLSESFSDHGAPGESAPLPEAAASVDPNLPRLRRALEPLLTIVGEEHLEDHAGARVYVFKGVLRIPVGEAHAQISARLAPLSFTPMLRRSADGERDEVAVAAVPGTLPDPRIRTRAWVHLLLLVITLLTTTVMGAALTGIPPAATWRGLRHWDTSVLWPALRDGAPFSLTLLAILGVHEMGHYIAARLHGVKVTLPFFIPLPLTGSLGTLGAVILIRSPLMNRRALFDVGIAGPLAGLLLALPLFLIGLRQDPVIGLPDTWIAAGIMRVSNPPLLDAIAPLAIDTANLDRFVFYRHPMALAAWFGVLLTALNLLPLGQFDGGHIAYALLGDRAWPLAWLTFVGLTLLGLMGSWFAWLIWAVMGLLSGLRHPPPHDDVLPLGMPRMLLGALTALLFVAIFVPVPFYAP